jgi:hypothetical protein
MTMGPETPTGDCRPRRAERQELKGGDPAMAKKKKAAAPAKKGSKKAAAKKKK